MSRSKVDPLPDRSAIPSHQITSKSRETRAPSTGGPSSRTQPRPSTRLAKEALRDSLSSPGANPTSPSPRRTATRREGRSTSSRRSARALAHPRRYQWLAGAKEIPVRSAGTAAARPPDGPLRQRRWTSAAGATPAEKSSTDDTGDPRRRIVGANWAEARTVAPSGRWANSMGAGGVARTIRARPGHRQGPGQRAWSRVSDPDSPGEGPASSKKNVRKGCSSCPICPASTPLNEGDKSIRLGVAP